MAFIARNQQLIFFQYLKKINIYTLKRYIMGHLPPSLFLTKHRGGKGREKVNWL